MSLRFVIDMNLTPSWINTFSREGHEAVHWSSIGSPQETDRMIMEYASTHGQVVFTHDLGFTAILALTEAAGPSVVLLRSQDTMPDKMGASVLSAIREHEAALQTGAIVVVDLVRSRVRVLPLP